MSTRGQRIGFGVVAFVAGAALFMLASAFMISRGLPHWLAAAVGGFAFPVGPITWHVLAERARRRKVAAAKTPPKAMLTGTDRFMLRQLAIGVLVLGPMIAIGKLGVVRAVWHHGLWFWPTTSGPGISHGGPLATIGSGALRTVDVVGTPLARVPADAELVIARQSEPGMAADRHLTIAWGERQLLFVDEGVNPDRPTDATELLNAFRGELPWLPIDELAEVTRSDSLYVAASQGWRFHVDPPSTGPNAELLHELGRAPKDAQIAAAFVPKPGRDARHVRAGAAWLVERGDRLVLEGRVEASDEAAAAQLAKDARRALAEAAANFPEPCRTDLRAKVRSLQLDQTGVFVTGRLEVDRDALDVSSCADDR